MFHLVNFPITPFKSFHHWGAGREVYNMRQKETQGIFFSFLLIAQMFHIYGPFYEIYSFKYKIWISLHNWKYSGLFSARFLTFQLFWLKLLNLTEFILTTITTFDI